MTFRVSDVGPNEAATRVFRIDPELQKRGWNLADRTQVRLEVPVDGYDAEPWNGVTDYCLYEPSGLVIAVIEAKRTSREPRVGEEQLRHYVDEIAKRQGFRPFGFMSNGLSWYFWDVGEANPRLVAGMFSPDDLKRLKFIRENAIDPATLAVNASIASRVEQQEAIRRVCEAFDRGRRRALVVMATGTGKTRTTMALLDLFLRARSAQKVLFLADRDALVEQALNDGFKNHLPDEPRDRVFTRNIDPDKRLYVATLQTMGRCFEQFSPAYFDIVVFDEAHRSIFNRFTEVMEYFDARMLGLTATPANFIDRDTFITFRCDGQTPTFLYTYQQAVAEKRLVDYRLYQAQTGFQRAGIRGADLDDDAREALIEKGIDPDTLDYSGTELEVLVSNKDTLRRQWEEIFDVCIKDRGGNLPGKTIVFATSKGHAERVRDVFEEMYPQHVGLLKVIHDGVERVHDGSYGDGLISKFKKLDKPRIAVSVDMLDTGIDVPEVVNLVFMRPVQSRIKLAQMIGRGTRSQETCRFFDRLPDGKKTEFLIIDFWQNDFGRQIDARIPAEVPLLIRLFHTRLDLLERTLHERDGERHRQVIADCRAMIGRIPVDSFLVRRAWHEVEAAWRDDFWSYLRTDQLQMLRIRVSPLLRFVSEVDVATETFTHKVEQLRLQSIAGGPQPTLLQSIAEDVSRLPAFVRDNPAKKTIADLALSVQLAAATPSQLTTLVRELAPEMKHKRRRETGFLTIDLPDFIAGRSFILVGPQGTQVHVEEYRRRIESRILAVAEQHPALVALREGREPDAGALIDLERLLERELSAPDVGLTDKIAHQAFGVSLDRRQGGLLGFMRFLLGLEGLPDYATVVDHGFELHIQQNRYSGDQIRFLRAVRDVFLANRRLAVTDLYEAPLTSFGRNAVDRLFTPSQVEGLVQFTNQLSA